MESLFYDDAYSGWRRRCFMNCCQCRFKGLFEYWASSKVIINDGKYLTFGMGIRTTTQSLQQRITFTNGSKYWWSGIHKHGALDDRLLLDEIYQRRDLCLRCCCSLSSARFGCVPFYYWWRWTLIFDDGRLCILCRTVFVSHTLHKQMSGHCRSTGGRRESSSATFHCRRRE